MKPAKLLVDTGAAQTIVLYAPFVEKHKLLETTAGTIEVAAGGLGETCYGTPDPQMMDFVEQRNETPTLISL